MSDDASSDLLTLVEAAHRAEVPRQTLRGWIKAGLLPTQRRGKLAYVRLTDLETAQSVVHVGTVIPRWRQDPVHAGTRLRTLREAASLSQLALAARSGISHEAISRLETGDQAPMASTVRRLAEALGAEPERFVSPEPLGPQLLTCTEAGPRLQVPPERVQVWLKKGWVPGTKVSGQWRVSAIVVAELARSGRLRGASRRLDPRYRG